MGIAAQNRARQHKERLEPSFSSILQQNKKKKTLNTTTTGDWALANAMFLMWGVAPHRIDAHMRDVQETRRNDYNASQPYYNHGNVNVIVMAQ